LASGKIRPANLTCEYLFDPQAIDVLNPRLSWINIAGTDERGQVQSAYEIRVAGTPEKLVSGNADLWNSGRVKSKESVNIPYNGKPLGSRQDCWWQVRVWDMKGRISEWSEPAFWSMGLLDSADWQALWIGAPWQGDEPLARPPSPKKPGQSVSPYSSPEDKIPPPAPMLRKSFLLNKSVATARAYVTGPGFFEFYVNGSKAGDDVLVPNVTLYGKRDDIGPIGEMTMNNFREYRVMYLSYDIRHLLRQGENVLGAILGNGFYNPASYWCEGYGTPSFLGQIHIVYTDGSEQIITSDLTWKASRSPIVMDLVYDGEHYDARLEQPGWCSPGFDDSNWEYVALRKTPEGKLKAHMSPTDKVMESLAPVRTEKLGDGHYRVDFGEEISGWLRLMDVSGEPGRRIEIKYICESHVGENSYTMKGGGPESYSACFTWFVFREVEITNWPGEFDPDQVRAEAVYTDIRTTGKFECSNELFEKINRIWWRSQTDNMHGGVASDCPHRERSPYTGDGQVACVTVMHNFDSRAFYTKWIRDILGAQNPDNGYVPNGAPWQPGCGGGVAWGAAINIMPWEFYLHYGDIDMLRENYEGMKGYVRYMLTWTDEEGIMHSQAPQKDKPNRWINLGEWVTPGPLPPDDMVHTFFLWRCAGLTATSASALGKNDEAEEYYKLAEKTRKAFQRKYFDEARGSYGPYGGNVFALRMGVPEEQKDRVVAALRNDLKANDDHLDTGIFGTQFLFEVLSENGLHELAYTIMNKRTQPGYGWWLEQGASTTWEHWSGSGSRNHPMFGGGIVWFYRILAGMMADPLEPGYRHIIFRPGPVADVNYAGYSNLTPYGMAAIKWEKGNGKFRVFITVPTGSTATIHVPATKPEAVSESGKKTKRSKDILFLRMEEGHAVYKVSSGNYRFESAMSM
jgi:alpha-L-rhamnosidase